MEKLDSIPAENFNPEGGLEGEPTVGVRNGSGASIVKGVNGPESGQFNAPESPLEDLLADMPPPGPAAEDEFKPSGRWEVSELRPRHREIMRRILEGATYVDIAVQMGIHVQTVMLIATSKLFREELIKLESQANSDVIRRAELMSNEALDVIKRLMRSARSEALQKSCADRILDTAGYAKVEKKLVGFVDGEAVIRELNRRRREANENIAQRS
jgi:hypothetical protein